VILHARAGSAVRVHAARVSQPMTNGRVIQILRDHDGSWYNAGDGYTEPRESWVDCITCDITLWSWQQYYFDTDEDPQEAIRQHQVMMLRKAGLLKGRG
jgi:hypothetical protein